MDNRLDTWLAIEHLLEQATGCISITTRSRDGWEAQERRESAKELG